MRGTILLLMIGMLVMSSGCNVADMVLDASYQSIKTWGKENFPLLKSELGEFALKEIGKAKDELKAYTREKTEALVEKMETKLESRTGVPAPEAKESIAANIAEFKRWWSDVMLENERRKNSTDPNTPKPLSWWEMILYGGLGPLVLGGGYAVKRTADKASESRAAKDMVDRRIGGYLRNTGLIGNVPVVGPLVQPPPDDPNK